MSEESGDYSWASIVPYKLFGAFVLAALIKDFYVAAGTVALSLWVFGAVLVLQFLATCPLLFVRRHNFWQGAGCSFIAFGILAFDVAYCLALFWLDEGGWFLSKHSLWRAMDIIAGSAAILSTASTYLVCFIEGKAKR